MKKHFNIRLEENLIQTLKEKAKQNRTTPTALITQWIEDYCNDTITTSDDEETDPYRTYSNDNKDDATTNQLKSAIADIQSRLAQLENDSNDIATTDYLDQRLAQALEPLWESLDYLPLSNDAVTTSDDAQNRQDNDDTVTTSNNDQANDIQTVTTDEYSNDSKDNATTTQTERSNNSKDSATTSDDISSKTDSDDKATTGTLESDTQPATTNKDSNDKTTTEQTPSIFPTEAREEENENVTPSKQSETQQKANVTEQFQDSRDDVNKSQGLEADTQTDAPSTNWMSAEETVAHLQGLGVSITKKKQLSDAVRSAKEESPEGYPKFSYRGYKFERRKYDSKTYQFRIVGRIDNSNTPQEQVISDSPQDSRGGLSGWLTHEQMRQWLAEREKEIGRRSLWKAAKKASAEGEKFTLNGMEFRQWTDEKGRKQYCCLDLGAS